MGPTGATVEPTRRDPPIAFFVRTSRGVVSRFADSPAGVTAFE
jgi:hypothetical protein